MGSQGVREGMEHIDRPAEVEGLPAPSRARRTRVERQPLSAMAHAQRPHRIRGHRGRGRDAGQRPPVGSPEAELAVGRTVDLVALLVHGAVVAAAEEGKVVEGGGAAVGPVAEVVALAGGDATAGEAAAAIAVEESAAQRGGEWSGCGGRRRGCARRPGAT
jgi:hypothetical protein